MSVKQLGHMAEGSCQFDKTFDHTYSVKYLTKNVIMCSVCSRSSKYMLTISFKTVCAALYTYISSKYEVGL